MNESSTIEHKVSVKSLQEILQNERGGWILDVRTPAEYASVRIDGAVLMPLDRLKTEEVEQHAGRKECCYVMCHSGARSEIAARKLEKAGFESVFIVDGGMKAWQKAGFPVHRKGRKVMPLDQQAFLAAGLLVLTGTVLAAMVSPWWLILTGFVGTGLTVRGLTGFCGMALLLSAAPWNRGAA